VIAVGTKGSNKKGGVVVKGIVPRDGEEKVLVDVFILGAPDFLTLFVDNGILVRVVGNSGDTRWGSKEVGEELGFWGDREQEVGEDGSRWGRRGNDGDRGFSNRQWEVFNGDVSKRDALDDLFKLMVDVGVLMFWGWGVLKLRAYYVSLLGGDVGKDVEEVGQSGDDGGWGWGAVGIDACSRVITTWAGVIPGVMGTIEIVLDDLVGSDDVDLVDIVNLRPVSNGEGGGDDKGW
jgi:hypothetical protein